MLYKSAQERFVEDTIAIEKVIDSLTKPSSLEEIQARAENEVGRSIELCRVTMVIKDMKFKNKLPKNEKSYLANEEMQL